MRRHMIYGCLVLGMGLLIAVPRQLPTDAAVEPSRTATHTEWVAKSLTQMHTVKVGMTRAELLQVFDEEGGISTPKARTYVYRECPYIKVDVTFTIVGRAERDADGRLTMIESPQDKIHTISKPYLDWSVAD